MAKTKQELKKTLEREYIVPLRKGWLKVPKYKRSNKAIKTLKEFLAQHMKIYDRDLRKIKIDINLNNEIKFKGMQKPLSKIKIKAIKYDNGIVRAELAELPKILQYKKEREDKKTKKIEKTIKTIEKNKEAITPKDIEESEEEKEKKEATRESTMKLEKEKAKELKHISKKEEILPHRKKLSR